MTLKLSSPPRAFLVPLANVESCKLFGLYAYDCNKGLSIFCLAKRPCQLLLQLVQWDQLDIELSVLSLNSCEILDVATIPPPRPVFLLVLDIALIEEELDQAKELVTSAWWQNWIPLN